FPLRMLSLQQMQRFADIFAAAELVRRETKIAGAPFSLGFFVGPATPNDIKPKPKNENKARSKEDAPDPDDPDMPERYRVLLRCPFCGSQKLKMTFNKA